MRLDDFDYQLPDDLIAQRPLAERDASRLMVVHRGTGEIEHVQFSDLPLFLTPGDLLVLNNTRVIPARLYGKKRSTGARIEMFLVHEQKPDHWQALIRPVKRVQRNTVIEFGENLCARIVQKQSDGSCLVKLVYEGQFREVLAELGQVPLPPYIKREPDADDQERYQNVYAANDGAVAAPTAGLHFTQNLLQRLAQMGVERTELTLHVGLGTFQPVKVEQVEHHEMHEEYFQFPQMTADSVNACKAQGGRVVAIGTTSVRTLESTATQGRVGACSGATALFVYPGYEFQIVDVMITNFHLPRSTLLMLVTAFGGYDLIMRAYREAVQQRYRFYSYGDAMLIL